MWTRGTSTGQGRPRQGWRKTYHISRFDQLRQLTPRRPIIRLNGHTLDERFNGSGILAYSHIQQTAQINQVRIGIVDHLLDKRVEFGEEGIALFLQCHEMRQRPLHFPIYRLLRQRSACQSHHPHAEDTAEAIAHVPGIDNTSSEISPCSPLPLPTS